MALAFWPQFERGIGRLLLPGQAKDHQALAAATAEAIAFIRDQTPSNAVFAVTKDAFWLRHTPGRPVCHSWKEVTSLMGRSYEKTRAWVRRVQQESGLGQRERALRQREAQLRKQALPRNEKLALWNELQEAWAVFWKQKTAVWHQWGAQYVLQPAWQKPRATVPGLKIEFENRYWFIARLEPGE
jgi:hypothetical protein